MVDVSVTAVLDLPIERRLEIVQTIWQSIVQIPEDLPVAEAERVELDGRLESYRRDPGGSKPWQEIRTRLLQEI